MRRLIVLLILLLMLCQCSTNQAEISPASARALSKTRLEGYRTITSSEKGELRLKKICTRLESIIAYEWLGAPRCKVRIIDAPQPLALSVDATEIIISQSLYQQLTSPGALFFVVAHEYAHLLLAHTAETNVAEEIAADRIGIELTYRAGFSLDDIPAVLALANRFDPAYEAFAQRRLEAARRHPWAQKQ